jgi:hypothetical protein
MTGMDNINHGLTWSGTNCRTCLSRTTSTGFFQELILSEDSSNTRYMRLNTRNLYYYKLRQSADLPSGCAACRELASIFEHFATKLTSTSVMEIFLRPDTGPIRAGIWDNPEDLEKSSVSMASGQVMRKGQWIDFFTSSGKIVWIGDLRIFDRASPSGDTSDDEAFEWVMEWIEYCEKNHTQCGDQCPQSMPTRLLDLLSEGGSDCIKLVELAEDTTAMPYATLSHCWGGMVPECRTTKLTLDDRLNGIPLGQLPKTFQEAVVFTRKLGIRYLWIDTMCIIQEDEDDWQRESKRMCTVYGNSVVTLAAVHAENASVGLFSKLDSKYAPMKLSKLEARGESMQLYARRHIPNEYEDDPWKEETDCPLFHRGWAFQERLVSPRTIYFTKHQLLWECKEKGASEIYGNAPRGSTDSHEECLKVQHFSALRGDDNSKLQIRRNKEHWYRIVDKYSTLSLTRQRDCLPALSALAEQTQQTRPGQRYLAGLWSGNLVKDLLWKAEPNETKFLSRPEKWRAPSWSWASVRGPVKFCPLAYAGDGSGPEVLDVHCTPLNNEFGEVISGRITMKGHLSEWGLGRDDESGEFFLARPDVEFQIGLDLDYDPFKECGGSIGLQHGATVHMLNMCKLCIRESRKGRRFILLGAFNLVLIRVAETNIYQRMGLAQIDGPLKAYVSGEKLHEVFTGSEAVVFKLD